MGTAKRAKRGMGSIYKISQDGAVLYRASTSITITDPLTGLKKRKRITGTGATAAIAISRMNDKLQERGGGILPSVVWLACFQALRQRAGLRHRS